MRGHFKINSKVFNERKNTMKEYQPGSGKRNEIIQDSRYFEYLVKLRDSGETNMYGAVPYLQAQFPELQRDFKRAEAILISWIHSFQTGNESEQECVK